MKFDIVSFGIGFAASILRPGHMLTEGMSAVEVRTGDANHIAQRYGGFVHALKGGYSPSGTSSLFTQM